MNRIDCSDWIDQQKPDCQEILQGLKDFQRDTVDYVFSRLYTDADSTRRFLVADEVGLGKTLVARGIIAKAIEHLWNDVPRIDILYICSDSNIANQNISKLNILKNEWIFDWNEIPGLEEGKLKGFIADEFGLDFSKSKDLKIEKIDNLEAIKIYAKDYSILLKFNSKQSNAVLELDDGRTKKYRAEKKDGKLKIFKDESPFATRISLMPLKIKNLNSKKVNFIALTPGTSFEVSSGTGIGEERALLYWMLKDEWDLNSGKPLRVFQGGMSRDNFRNMIKNFDTEQIDSDLKARFIKLLRNHDRDKQKNSEYGLRERIKKLSEDFSKPRLKKPEKRELERESNSCISELRSLLVKACLNALEPDLIILDEFQRFKHLICIGEEDESSASARELAQELFSYADENSKARVLLLSATPYKMYTTYDEIGNDDHYQDFLDTFRFLVTDPKLPEQSEYKVNECDKTLKGFRDELFQIGQNDCCSRIKDLKKNLECQLRKVMVRTEKIEASEDGNGMLKVVCGDSSNLMANDLSNYCAIQKISESLNCGEPMEYWKSSPYLLNFMDNYELKDAFREAASREHCEIYNPLSDTNGLLLPWKDIEAYKKIDPENSRLRDLLSGTIGADTWKLLWMPPSLQYYKLGEPFSDPSLREFTKRLVFSSWRMVPRMISSLMSYEAERYIIQLFNPSFSMADAREKIKPLLRLKSSEKGGRPGGMPIIGMIYPSIELAMHCDPLMMASRSQITLDHAVKTARTRIEELLKPLTESSPKSGIEDDNWYWAAPILIDIRHHPSIGSLLRKALRDIWTGKDNVDEEEEDDKQTGLWMDAIKEVADLVDGETKLGRPPKDLSLVLAKMAIAGPGTASLRALSRITGGLNMTLEDIWIGAANMAFSFIRLFNRKTSNALLRGLYSSGSKGNIAYWKHVLDYCLAGGLQMVLDEYVHFLKESEGIYGLDRKKASEKISATVVEALGIKSVNLNVDDIVCNAKSKSISLSDKKMSTNFAVMLSDRESDASQSVNRISQVRKAFNSPFWPFVLATTSIGQEGLDFHAYCHAVVHWNLPSNPVDLEQREGRVHRFKGHAIRKNLATKYGLSTFGPDDVDPWEAIFAAGKRDRKLEDLDIVPFWIWPNGKFKIQRHVPALPLSRDRIRMQDLKRSLAVYRMVFGQPRQEDLVEYLTKRLGKDVGKLDLDCLRIDLSPPQSKSRIIGQVCSD